MTRKVKMKISKTLVAAAIATSLVFSGSFTANAVAGSDPTPSATAAPISSHVDKHDKKAIQDARKSANEMQKKLDRIAQVATDQAAIAAWQAAVEAWKVANADALAARKVIEKTLHDAVKASDKAVHEAQDAVKTAQKALGVVKVGGDATQIAAAQAAVNNAINAANTARATREKVRTDALKGYNDAISALGALPEKPAKPVLGKGSGLGSDKGKNQGGNKKNH
jgi:hypothetical protein